MRDSARLATTAQHPSFDVSLRGRQDVVLSHLGASPSAMDVTQTESLEVIHLGSGIKVVETPPGKQQIRLALPPGRYVVRRVVGGRVLSKEIEIPGGRVVALSDTQLEAVGDWRIAAKGAEDATPFGDASTPRRNWWELRLGLGVSTGPGFSGAGYVPPERPRTLERRFAGVLSFSYGITDRLTWMVPLPALAYRIGTEGSFEVIPRAGLTSIGYSGFAGVVGTAAAGVTTRTWATPRLSVITDVSGARDFGDKVYERWAARANGGLSLLVADVVTLSAGVGIASETFPRTDTTPGLSRASIEVGAVQSIGFRPVPLVSVHVSRRFSVDAYASWSFGLQGQGTQDRYLGGFTWAF